jgi:beta-galactosidase
MKHVLLSPAILAAISCFLLLTASKPAQQSRALSISGNHFVSDGKPYQIISGAMHYPRIPREYWADRLQKAHAMGLNTVETYIFWNLHEPQPGVFNFAGNLDVAEYVRLAQQEGLNVIVRPGPYVCSEWDFGGLPAWLFADPNIEVRTTDPKFLAAADRYLMRVGQELAPLQASRGGPIIMVQIENEYGSFGADKEYMEHIRQTLVRAGFGESILYTADGPDRLARGTLRDVLAVANFGPGTAKHSFAKLQRFEPGWPVMSGEYWDGWFDSWGIPRHTTNAAQQTSDITWMLAEGYSLNLYMFHGGTTFGFLNGANFGSGPGGFYQPQTTSYDYDAPLDESGRPTKKYFLFRDAISHATGVTPPDLPEPLPRMSISDFPLDESTSLWDNLPSPVPSERPQSMEALGQAYGYLLYRTEISGPHKALLTINGLHDYANVYINQRPVGWLDRRLKQDRMELTIPSGTATLDVLVENLGRINFGPHMRDDRKGILGSVTLEGRELTGWQIFNLPMSDLSRLQSWKTQPTPGPAFHRGTFAISAAGDTFLDVQNLAMGIVWVNGHNLGRVWNIGPQRSLYLPAPWLHSGANEVIVFDSIALESPRLRGVTEPIWK